jgi:hypothetical protein
VRLSAALLCAFAAGLAIAAGASAAGSAYVHVGSFGAQGSGPGELSAPRDVAVDPISGEILVADTGSARVDVYRPTPASAEFLFSFGAGELVEPLAVAVDPTGGAVYVSDPGLGAIVKFRPDVASAPTSYSLDPAFAGPAQGSEEGQVGSFGEAKAFGVRIGAVAVDPTTGDLLVADPARGLVERYSSGGAYLEALDGSASGAPLTAPADISVSAEGTILVSDIEGETEARVIRLAPDGSYLGESAPLHIGAPAASGVPVALDPTGVESFVGSKEALFGGPAKILRFETSGALAQEIEDPSLGGLATAIAAAGGGLGARLYILASASVFGPRTVSVFEAVAPPAVTVEPPAPSDLGTDHATFHGSVDPGGSPVGECSFQYVTAAHLAAEGFAGAASLPCEPTPGSGEGPEAVAAAALGLEPATAYAVRLRATGQGGAPGLSTTERFATLAAPPVVETGRAWSLTDAGATLSGSVDPRNSALTGCRFEYGPSAAYGSSVPCAPTLTSGPGALSVTAEVGALTPGSEYHFRLLATGGTGLEQAGSDQTFQTRTLAASALPARGYELVPAADINGIEPLPIAASADGDAYAYATFIPSPGAESGGKALFRSVRRPDGTWVPAYVGTPPALPGEPASGGVSYLFAAGGLGTWTFDTSQSLDRRDANHTGDIYVEGIGAPASWASGDPFAQGAQTEGPALGDPAYISPDGSRVLFESRRHLLAGDRSSAGSGSLYEWDRGTLSLLGILPGESAGPEAGSELGSGPENQLGTSYGAVSADGSRVAFQSADESLDPELYVRIDGSRTVRVSKSAPGVEPPVASPLGMTFWGADSGMDVVVFSSSSALTQDSAAGGSPGEADLYAYDLGTGALHDLTPHAEGGGVERVYAVSEDGRRVYFTSSRLLEPGHGSAGEANLYLAELGAGGAPAAPPRFIATIDPTEARSGTGGLLLPQAWREVATNPDGSVLAFRDRLAAVPGRATGSRPQLYVYEAATGSLACASCPGDGRVPGAGANLVPSVPGAGAEEPGIGFILNLIADTGAEHITDVTPAGAVFFQTANALVGQDTNGRIDVYEWHGGRLALVSAGSQAHDSILAGASMDGSTVFFSSADGLTPGAQDGVPHIYAARVGGGAPAAPTPSPRCGESDCRPAPAGPAPAAAVASTTIPAAAARRRKPRRPHRHHRRAHRRHGARRHPPGQHRNRSHAHDHHRNGASR